ncbi:MAG: hypothetical protein V4515_01720 [Chloroflexota bacterium]
MTTTGDDAVILETEWQSIIATEWVLALGPHLEFLLRPAGPWAPIDGPKGGWENAHSMAVIAMGTFAIESFVGRVAEPNEDALRALIRIATSAGRPPPDHIREVFVLRDVLVHGHVWQISDEVTLTDDSHAIRTISRELSRGRKDKKYLETVDPDLGLTKPRGLHVIPSYIGRREAAAVLNTNLRLADMLANMRSIGDTWLRVGDSIAILRSLSENLDSAAQT